MSKMSRENMSKIETRSRKVEGGRTLKQDWYTKFL